MDAGCAAVGGIQSKGTLLLYTDGGNILSVYFSEHRRRSFYTIFSCVMRFNAERRIRTIAPAPIFCETRELAKHSAQSNAQIFPLPHYENKDK